jgi:hypothetical protein
MRLLMPMQTSRYLTMSVAVPVILVLLLDFTVDVFLYYFIVKSVYPAL